MCSSKGNQEVDNGIGGLWHCCVTARSGVSMDLAPQIRQATNVRHTPVSGPVSPCVAVSELLWVSPAPQDGCGAAARCWCPHFCPYQLVRAQHEGCHPSYLQLHPLSPFILGLFCDLPEVFLCLNTEHRGKELSLVTSTPEGMRYGGKGNNITSTSCFGVVTAVNACICRTVRRVKQSSMWNFTKETEGHAFTCSVSEDEMSSSAGAGHVQQRAAAGHWGSDGR